MRGDFVLVDAPVKQPAVDYITRSGEGPFVDTGVDVQYIPEKRMQIERIYLSVETIRHLAQVAGILSETPNTAIREAELIALGKLQGLKENYGGDLADLARVLGSIARDARVGRVELRSGSSL